MISEDGLVVTNAHVVASSIGGEEPVMITLTDGRRFSAKVREGGREGGKEGGWDGGMEDGLVVVTNAHVIASSIGGEEPVMITLTDGRRFPAKVVSSEGKGGREGGRGGGGWLRGVQMPKQYCKPSLPPSLPPLLAGPQH